MKCQNVFWAALGGRQMVNSLIVYSDQTAPNRKLNAHIIRCVSKYSKNHLCGNPEIFRAWCMWSWDVATNKKQQQNFSWTNLPPTDRVVSTTITATQPIKAAPSLTSTLKTFSVWQFLPAKTIYHFIYLFIFWSALPGVAADLMKTGTQPKCGERTQNNPTGQSGRVEVTQVKLIKVIREQREPKQRQEVAPEGAFKIIESRQTQFFFPTWQTLRRFLL